jgi:hypothetical protein
MSEFLYNNFIIILHKQISTGIQQCKNIIENQGSSLNGQSEPSFGKRKLDQFLDSVDNHNYKKIKTKHTIFNRIQNYSKIVSLY